MGSTDMVVGHYFVSERSRSTNSYVQTLKSQFFATRNFLAGYTPYGGGESTSTAIAPDSPHPRDF